MLRNSSPVAGRAALWCTSGIILGKETLDHPQVAVDLTPYDLVEETSMSWVRTPQFKIDSIFVYARMSASRYSS